MKQQTTHEKILSKLLKSSEKNSLLAFIYHGKMRIVQFSEAQVDKQKFILDPLDFTLFATEYYSDNPVKGICKSYKFSKMSNIIPLTLATANLFTTLESK